MNKNRPNAVKQAVDLQTQSPLPVARAGQDGLLDRLIVTGSGFNRMRHLLRFLLVDGGLVRDPVLVYAILSSLSRAILIFSINETARTLATEPLPIVALLISAAFVLLFSHLARVRNHQVIRRLQRDMRQAMSTRIMTADVDFLLKQNKGQVYSVMTHEIEEVSGAAINLVEALEAALLVLICVPYLFWISWFTGISIIVAVGVGAMGYIFVEIPARRLVEQANDASARFFDRVNDMLSGWMEIRLRASRQRDLEADITKTINEIKDYSVQAEHKFSGSQAFAQGALIALICAVVVLLPLLQGADTTTLFQVLTVVLLTNGPIEAIFNALPRMSRAVASQKKIGDVVAHLSSEHPRTDIAALTKDAPAFETIELRNIVAHVGEGGRPGVGELDAFKLGPINLKLRTGETVFIAGGNGTGKSTLLAIIAGLRKPDEGEVLLNGEVVDFAELGNYRSNISAVFSNFHLFQATYGLSKDEQGKLGAMITRLGLAEIVQVRDNRLSTIALSSGQRRRLALSVAMAENRPVVLLDEFAADQDPANRQLFYRELIPELGQVGRLVVAVTHDEQNFDRCDRLIRMKDGQILSDERNKVFAGK